MEPYWHLALDVIDWLVSVFWIRSRALQTYDHVVTLACWIQILLLSCQERKWQRRKTFKNIDLSSSPLLQLGPEVNASTTSASTWSWCCCPGNPSNHCLLLIILGHNNLMRLELENVTFLPLSVLPFPIRMYQPAVSATKNVIKLFTNFRNKLECSSLSSLSRIV